MGKNLTIPEWLVVGEPELKWCEAIIHTSRGFGGEDDKSLLLRFTNMSEIRINRALNLLRQQKRI